MKSIGPTLQEILDTTATHLYKQNMRCVGPVYDYKHSGYKIGNRYKYDTIDRCFNCSVGVWINGEYTPEMEGLSLDQLLAVKSKNVPEWMLKSDQDHRCKKTTLLYELQMAHDLIQYWEEDGTAGEKLKKELKRIAKEHKLKVTTINKLQSNKAADTGKEQDDKPPPKTIPKKKVRSKKGK